MHYATQSMLHSYVACGVLLYMIGPALSCSVSVAMQYIIPWARFTVVMHKEYVCTQQLDCLCTSRKEPSFEKHLDWHGTAVCLRPTTQS